MDSSLTRLARALRSLRVPSVETAVMASATAVVGADGQPVELPIIGWYTPTVGEQVLVLRAGGYGWILGGFTPGSSDLPTFAPITGVSSGSALVTIAGTSVSLPTQSAVTVGSTALIMWDRTSRTTARGLIIGQRTVLPPEVALSGSAATAPTPVTDTGTPTVVPTAGLTARTRTILATDTATWRGGKWRTDTDDLVQGDSSWGRNYGYAWYPGLSDIDPATVSAIEVRVPAKPRAYNAAPAPTIATHDQAQRGGAQPTTYESLTGPSMRAGSVVWVDLTPIKAAVLSRGGLALVGPQYMRVLGLADDPQSLAIRITTQE